MNAVVEILNAAGQAFVEFALPMLIQSCVLIVILLAVDAVLRRKVRAVFRYWIWMLVLVKLVLPPSLGSPVSVGTWFGETLETPAVALLESEPQPAELSPMISALLSGPDPRTAEPIIVPPSTTAASTAPVEASKPQTPIPTPVVPLSWQGLMLLTWAVVVLALTLLLIQRAFFVRGLLGQSEEASRDMLNELENCCRRLGLRRAVRLRLSPNATSPAVCGLLRPVILIPQSIAPRLQSHDLRAVLLHELAHVKRGDLWVNLIQTLLQIAYFYNPLLWLANAMIRRTREQAVDETVLVAMGETARQYPEILVNIAKLAFTRRPALSLRLIGVVESKSALTARIQHILTRPLPTSAKLGVIGLLSVLILAAVLLPMAKAQDETNGVFSRLAVLPNCGVWTSDINGQDLPVLDLATEKIVVLLDVKKEYDLLSMTEARGEGDILYYFDVAKNAAKITFLRRAGLGGEPLSDEYETVTITPMEVPFTTTVATRGGNRFNIEIIRADEQACSIRFQPLNDSPPTFKAILSDGIVAEFLGVYKQPGKGQTWWRPDGMGFLSEGPLESECFESLKSKNFGLHPSHNEAVCAAAIRVYHGPNTGTVNVSISPSRREATGAIDSRTDGVMRDLCWPATLLLRSQKSCSVRCEIWTGPWETTARASVGSLGKLGATVGGVTFGSPADDPNRGATITVSHGRPDRFSRVAALLTDGHIVYHNNVRYDEGGPLIQEATADFQGVALADVEEFQFQTRPSTRIDFRNVSLRPGQKTDLQIHAQSSDARHTAPEVVTASPLREIVLPDVDREAKMLDLATGGILPLPQAGSPDEIWRAIGMLGRGDLVYDSNALILVREAVSDQAHVGPTPPFKTYDIKPPLPVALAVTTAEGARFEVTILAADERCCALKYSRIPADRVAGGEIASLRKSIPIGPGGESHNETVSSAGESSGASIYLPDLEKPGADTVLDLETRKFLSGEPMQRDPEYLDKLGKGDLAYEWANGKSGLLCFRGTRILEVSTQRPDGRQMTEAVQPDVLRREFEVYFIDAPRRYRVATARGEEYELNVISIDKGDSGGALVEIAKVADSSTTASTGGVLEFRIAPRSIDLDADLIEKLKQMRTHGGVLPESDFAWFPIRMDLTGQPYAITRGSVGKAYVLLCNKPPHAILASQDWGLESVYRVADANRRPAIGLTFNDKGASLFHDLTAAHVQQNLAIVVEGTVVAMPNISAPLGRAAIITGNFTEQEIGDIMASLRTEMVQQSSSRPQQGLFEIHGVATDDSGRPMAGVDIGADCDRRLFVSPVRTATDGNGRYVIRLELRQDVSGDIHRADARARAVTVTAGKFGFYEANLCRHGDLVAATGPFTPDDPSHIGTHAGVILPHESYELNFILREAARIEGVLVDAVGLPLVGQTFWLSGREAYPGSPILAGVRTDSSGKFAVENVPLKSFWFTYDRQSLVKSDSVDFTAPGTWRLRLQYRQFEQRSAVLEVSDVQEPASGQSMPVDWQNISEAIPPDANDTRTLAPGVVLDGIGEDVEGKVFVASIRDLDGTAGSEYRFVIHWKDGRVQEPRYRTAVDRFGRRLWEKFTFDAWYDDLQIESFRLQSRPIQEGRGPAIPSPKDEITIAAGTAKPAPSSAAPPGRYAMSFDGQGDYLYVPDSESLRKPESLAVEVWIKPQFPEEAGKRRRVRDVLAKGAYTGTGRARVQGFGIQMARFDPNANTVMFDRCQAADAGIIGRPMIMTLPADWLHITQTFDDYIPAPGQPLVIGRFLIPANDPLCGKIAEIRIWDDAKAPSFSQYEGKALTGNEPGLVACWTFEEGGGQIAHDISPNANHARLGSSIGEDDADPTWVGLPADPL
jgi:beta-lactamase regulating signal transducer with metallopeptidase domain